MQKRQEAIYHGRSRIIDPKILELDNTQPLLPTDILTVLKDSHHSAIWQDACLQLQGYVV